MVYIKIVWFVVSHGSAIPPYDETNYTDIPEYKNTFKSVNLETSMASKALSHLVSEYPNIFK